MNMRRSKVLEKLRAGGLPSCTKINLDSARAAEIAAQAGFDCVWVDYEHTATDLSMIERQVWATKAYDVDLLVRVSRGCYSDYSRALELDATGIMVPHIMSAADAREVIHMTRFHPLGRRALDGGNADGAYCQIAQDDYLHQSNTQRFVVFQIEDPEPMDELDAIAALEGFDMLFFGPGDFSHAIGEPGNFAHPRVLKARARVAEACQAHGKFAGTVGSPANIAELTALGYNFVSMGADVLGLVNYWRDIMAGYKNLATDEH